MSSSLITILLLFVGSCYVAALTEKECNEALAGLAKRMTGTMSTCSKQMKFKNLKEKTSKSNCVFKCVMIAEGFLNQQALITDETIKVYFDKMVDVPEEVKGTIRSFVVDCKQKTSAGFDPSPADEFCKTYDPFFKCMMVGVKDMCAGIGKS